MHGNEYKMHGDKYKTHGHEYKMHGYRYKNSSIERCISRRKAFIYKLFSEFECLIYDTKKTAKNTIYINIYNHTDLPGGIGML